MRDTQIHKKVMKPQTLGTRRRGCPRNPSGRTTFGEIPDSSGDKKLATDNKGGRLEKVKPLYWLQVTGKKNDRLKPLWIILATPLTCTTSGLGGLPSLSLLTYFHRKEINYYYYYYLIIIHILLLSFLFC